MKLGVYAKIEVEMGYASNEAWLSNLNGKLVIRISCAFKIQLERQILSGGGERRQNIPA